jgi:AcrR family transcriptional regulator
MNRKIKLTKKCIQDSLFELLETTDINKISIKKLCEIADINRSTFYKYYGSQYDVLKEYEDKQIQNINDQICKNPNETNLATILSYIKENKNMFNKIYPESMRKDFLLKVLNISNLKQEMDLLCQDDEYAKLYILFGGIACIATWIESNCKESPEFIAQKISENTFKIAKK